MASGNLVVKLFIDPDPMALGVAGSSLPRSLARLVGVDGVLTERELQTL